MRTVLLVLVLISAVMAVADVSPSPSPSLPAYCDRVPPEYRGFIKGCRPPFQGHPVPIPSPRSS